MKTMVPYYLRQRHSVLQQIRPNPSWRILCRIAMLIAAVVIGVLLAFIPKFVHSQPQLLRSNLSPAITVNSLESIPSLLPLPKVTGLHIADSFPDTVTKTERLGNLMVGMASEQIVKLLGNPLTQSPRESEQCTGAYHQVWEYPNQGIVLQLVSDTQDGVQTLERIVAQTPSQLKTKRGIGIGSSWNAVKQAYADLEERQLSIPGKLFLIGTVQKDDVMAFEFQRQRVSRIIIPYEVNDC